MSVNPSPLLRATGLLAFALWVAGCPAPTGQRRGPLNRDGGVCAQLAQRPLSGESCSSSGLSCDFEAPCSTHFGADSFVQNERCSCNSGRWSCLATSACFERLRDGGISCPLTDDPSVLSFACDERYLNRTCQLPLFECADGSRPALNCTCDGNLWQCEPVQCADPRPDAGETGVAGRPCTSDFECAGLSCDTSVRGGVCTRACTNSSSQGFEQMQCGGSGTTCVATSDVDAACLQACTPRQGGRPSQCRPGFVCTGLWFVQPSGMPDTSGCFGFCSSDSDCAAGVQCNPRTGRCGEMPENPMGLPDGTPCPIDNPTACRGTCFRITERGSVGICGSFIDLERTRDCPDGMGVEPLTPGNDNLGLCVFRRCDESICCPGGTVCEGDGTAGFCTIDTPEVANIPCGATDSGASDASMTDASSRDGGG